MGRSAPVAKDGMNMKNLLAISVMLLPGLASAHEYRLGDLLIDHPVAFETPPTAMSGAGYMTITNNGDTDDRLLSVAADFPRVMIHETVTENDVAKMIHLEAVDLPAGETVSFAPGGKHVMFMGLKGDPLEVGETITATLTFEQAGEIELVFNVEARDGSEDHSNH